MLHADRGQGQNLDGSGLRIAIVQARFNENITNGLHAACRQELAALGVADAAISHHTVPGALEVPVALAALATQKRYDALVALGCVIRGATYHFELVANESASGITQVVLAHGVPVVNAILTVENIEQAIERQNEKGREAARVAVEMARLLHALRPTAVVPRPAPARKRADRP